MAGMDYAGHYSKLIERARNRSLDVYTEVHHVVPRCIGGTDEPANLVRLTPEEHYVAHQLLVKMHPGNRNLVLAICAMRMDGRTGGRSRNKQFGWLRRRMAAAIRELKTGVPRPPHIGEAVANRNRSTKQSKETRAKRSASLSGKPKSPEHVAKVAAALKGRPGTRLGAVHSAETKEKIRQAALARKMDRDAIKRINAAKTPEQRRAAALKAWETKRAKAHA